jgi:hypothetical protein
LELPITSSFTEHIPDAPPLTLSKTELLTSSSYLLEDPDELQLYCARAQCLQLLDDQ